MVKASALCVLALMCLLAPGCVSVESQNAAKQRKADAALQKVARVEHELWRSLGGWKRQTYRNKELLAMATPENTSIQISLNEQRGLLLVRGAVAMDFPLASGKKSHPTPTGSYAIRAKEKDYNSNLYGKIYDVAGVVVEADADTRQHAVPEGGKFEGASMPYWMRLTDSGVGLHVGYVPGGRTASHGCVRLKRADAAEIFNLVKIGTPVIIANEAPVLAQEAKDKKKKS